jgi:hypothetical protein
MLSLQPRSVPPSSLLVEEERVEGEGKERQACSAAPALNLAPPGSIALQRHRRYPPSFPSPFWRCYAQVVNEAHRFSPLQPMPLPSAKRRVADRPPRAPCKRAQRPSADVPAERKTTSC